MVYYQWPPFPLHLNMPIVRPKLDLSVLLFMTSVCSSFCVFWGEKILAEKKILGEKISGGIFFFFWQKVFVSEKLISCSWQLTVGRWQLLGGGWQVVVSRWQVKGGMWPNCLGALRKTGIRCPHHTVHQNGGV